MDLASAAKGLRSLNKITDPFLPGVTLGFMGSPHADLNSTYPIPHIVLFYDDVLANNSSYGFYNNPTTDYKEDLLAQLKSVLNNSREMFMIDLFKSVVLPHYQKVVNANEETRSLNKFFHLLKSGMLPSAEQFASAAISLKSLKNLIGQLRIDNLQYNSFPNGKRIIH